MSLLLSIQTKNKKRISKSGCRVKANKQSLTALKQSWFLALESWFYLTVQNEHTKI